MKPPTLAGICQGPSSTSTRSKSGCGPGLGELPHIRCFSCDISATDEDSDFKFGMAWVCQGPS